MKKIGRFIHRASIALLLSASSTGIATAQQPGAVRGPSAGLRGLDGTIQQYAPGSTLAPRSSLPLLASDTGVKARTHLRMVVPPPPSNEVGAQIKANGAQPFGTPPFSGYFYETPGSIQCVYGLISGPVGCNPNTTTGNYATGGSRAIAIVDAYHYANAQTDLATFSAQFGLPAPTGSNFQVVFASGVQPADAVTYGWDVESALDTQWAHAMAPSAKIYLVEAATNSYADLFTAVDVATQLVQAAGGGQVSMSWGGGEFSSESSYDSHFNGTNVVYFASSGDTPGTSFPCVSPKVVCVGGTSHSRNGTTGVLKQELIWESTGGGLSAYYPRPAYQNALAGPLGNSRGVPDIGAIADPKTGVWVYLAGHGGWNIIGGTSASAPIMAGIVNYSGTFAASSAAELQTIYAAAGTNGWFNTGNAGCGTYLRNVPVQGAGWNRCTGWGTPRGTLNK